MPGKVVLWLIAFLLLIVSFNFGHPAPAPSPAPTLERIIKIYRKADSLFHLSNTTPIIDSSALAGFEEVIADLVRYPGVSGAAGAGGAAAKASRDTLLFQSWLKKGILLDSRNNYTGAKDAYLMALRLHTMRDSASFVASVYTGTCYYNLNNFDSANYFLLKAEPLVDRFRDPDDAVRLYNTLGVLYYDNGNYRQGKNYFSRALDIVRGRQPMDTMSAVSIETNIATSYYRLGSYDESLSRYADILRYHVFANYVYMNMGRAYTALNQYREALASFRKVNAAKIPWVYNELAHTEWLLNRPDSCAYFLDRLQPYRDAGKLNRLDIGINECYRADLLNGQRQYRAALASLQKAIIIFSGNFSNPDIFSNPSSFAGTFTYYRLFDAQLAKARVFERLYRSDSREAWLAAAYEAYKAALAILRYIEKSYDTDDAKLFLKKKSGQVYQEAMSVCLGMYRLHPQGRYLEDAFLIGERNKASIIAAGMKERTFAGGGGIGAGTTTEEELLKKERNIKYNIARLNVRSDETGDSKEIEQMARERSGYEIELAHLQKGLEQNGNYYRLKYDDSSPGIKELQRRLGAGQALISCYMTAEALHIFTITQTSFGYTRVDSLRILQQDIGDWLNLLKTTGNGRKFKGDALGSRLYDHLIKPIQALVAGKDEWIVIPDGVLYLLPFESLPAGRRSNANAAGDGGIDGGTQTLLETTTISYQFSSRFLTDGFSTADGNGGNGGSDYKVLAFAPFAGTISNGHRDAADSDAGHPRPAVARQAISGGFNPLPASGDEIAGLPGVGYVDSMATKSRFLREMNDYPIIHLATHAVSAIDNVSASFIAFYPEKGLRAEDCLFLEELYGLDMRSTKLVIISACETGQGELVSNEGVISLARAFAYAGCASTVCSLWKADDKATSYILKRFHVYLQEGYAKAKALQKAKLDYIRSDGVNKSPAYWSHLILIGNEQPVCGSSHFYRWVMAGTAAVLFAAGILFVMRRKRKKKKSTLFMEAGL
jgi:CHAT domain-containing protein